MNKKRKIIIIIFIIVITLSIGIFSIFIIHKKEQSLKNDNSLIPLKDKQDVSNNTNEPIISDDKNENTESNNNIGNNNSLDNKTSNTEKNESSSSIQFYCPDGFSLENDLCIQVISANYVCPEGTTDYSNDNIPRDMYCVNLSEGYDSDTDSCPDNFGVMAIVNLGEPTTYRCLVLRQKYYTCDNGYYLRDNNCIKQVPAKMK